jgi:transposase
MGLKLTPYAKGQINKLAAKGMSAREIADRMNQGKAPGKTISKSTIADYLKDKKANTVTTPTPKQESKQEPKQKQDSVLDQVEAIMSRVGGDGEQDEESYSQLDQCEHEVEQKQLSVDEQRNILSGVGRGLADMISKARAINDDDGVIRATRIASVVFQSLRRLNPPEELESDVVKVRASDMNAVALKCKEKLHKLLDRALERRGIK